MCDQEKSAGRLSDDPLACNPAANDFLIVTCIEDVCLGGGVCLCSYSGRGGTQYLGQMNPTES